MPDFERNESVVFKKVITACNASRALICSAFCHSPRWHYSRYIGKIARNKFVVITVYGSESIDETERPKNKVMRVIERLF